MNNLTNEELVQLIQDGDDYANTVLLENNQGLVWEKLRKYKSYTLLDEDSKIEACYSAFVKATRSFDALREVKFSTYYNKLIEHEIHQEYLKMKSKGRDELIKLTFSYDNELSSNEDLSFKDLILKSEDAYFNIHRLEDIDYVNRSLLFCNEKIRPYIVSMLLKEVSQKDVALRVGLSRKTVNECVIKFKKVVQYKLYLK